MKIATKLVILLLGLFMLMDLGASEEGVFRNIVKRNAQQGGGQGGAGGPGGPGGHPKGPHGGGPPGGQGGQGGAGGPGGPGGQES